MGIARRAQAIRADLPRRRARLPWAELEAEARRQGCSAADIFLDRAGRVAEIERPFPSTGIGRQRAEPVNPRRRMGPVLRAGVCRQDN